MLVPAGSLRFFFGSPSTTDRQGSQLKSRASWQSSGEPMLRPDKTNRRNLEPSLLLAARTLLHFSRSPFLRASIFVLLCLAFANSDAGYRQLRDVGLGNTYRCEKFTLAMGAGTFELKSGTITLLGLVNNTETGAIFIGQGHFTLKPFMRIDTQEMVRRSGNPTAEEDFTEVVFRFTGGVYPQFSAALGSRTDTPSEAATAFQHWKNKIRHRHEVPEGFTQAILEEETIDNVDADVLAAVYNPKHPPFFNAYMVGTPHKDLRFFVRTRVGAIPQMDSPEEVALINSNGGGMDDGVWYSEHLISEWKAHT